MDSDVSENTIPRRSSRLSSKGYTIEATRRPPIRNAGKRKNSAPVAPVNGSEDVVNGSEDEGSPGKKSRLEPSENPSDTVDENEMEVQEGAKEQPQDADMDIGQDSFPPRSPHTPPPATSKGPHGDGILSPPVFRQSCFEKETERGKPSTGEPAAFNKSNIQTRSSSASSSSQIRHHDRGPKYGMEEYQRKLLDQGKTLPPVNHHTSGVSSSGSAPRHRFNNVPSYKPSVVSVLPKDPGINKASVAQESAASSSRGFIWPLCQSLVLLLFTSAVVLLAYKIVPALRMSAVSPTRPSGSVNATSFLHSLSLLQTQFANQRPDLWKRSRIHLETHLKTAQPKEPVSLILAAGLRAERTLRCLAQGLASSFSSALNASVLHLDGASRASSNSDEVKLDIDTQLRVAFEGDKPAAVIHRFDSLPPGSTLIFYRYCDHENAAYKRAFLLFTVLLPKDEIDGELKLTEVEEVVQDYVKNKLVPSNQHAGFNKMDMDKFGGLWSRISHLILPVVSEEDVEKTGC